MVDLDQILSYNTVKIVKIYDRRLGIIHHVFQVGILAYIIATIVLQQRYLRTDTPIGTVRATLREPNINLWNKAEVLPYCIQNQTYLVNSHGNFTNYACIYPTGNDITYPPAPQGSIFATTRMRDTTLRLPAGCEGLSDPKHPRSPSCFPVAVSASESFYIAEVSEYTVFLEHAIYGQINKIATTNNDLKGEFYIKGQEEPELISGPRAGDVFTLQKLLEAAGISSLDVPSGVPKGSTLRYDGVQIIAIVTYSNRASKPSELKYRYDFDVIPGVDSVAFEPSVATNATDTVSRKRNGIKLVFIIAGTIGIFDFQTLIVNLVGAFVLLKAATTLVDLLMEYVMPDKNKYKSHKYEESEDFSDVRGRDNL